MTRKRIILIQSDLQEQVNKTDIHTTALLYDFLSNNDVICQKEV